MFIEYLDCFNSDVWRSSGYGKCGVDKKEFSELSKKYSLFQKVTSRHSRYPMFTSCPPIKEKTPI